jgi:hypothetical protein
LSPDPPVSLEGAQARSIRLQLDAAAEVIVGTEGGTVSAGVEVFVAVAVAVGVPEGGAGVLVGATVGVLVGAGVTVLVGASVGVPRTLQDEGRRKDEGREV